MLSEENETEGMEVITSVETAPCDVCKSNPRVYKCPRCAAYSCSLECCRQHKITMECSGVRDRTEFVSTRNFKESDLKNDFHFLEDVLQSKDRAKRTLNQNFGGEKKTPPPNKKKQQNVAVADNEIPLILQDTYQRLESYPKSVKNLFQAAKERSIKLVLMPNQMTKRMLNKSLFNPKEGAIFWKVYVVFIVDSSFKNEELFRVDLDSSKPSQKLSFAQEALIGVGIDGVNENKTLSEIFEKLVLSDNESHRHALSSLRKNRSNMRCLMHRIPSPTSSPIFIESSMASTLKESLAGQTIIEYPTLYFGSYAHTERLHTLIAEEVAEGGAEAQGGVGAGIAVISSVEDSTAPCTDINGGVIKGNFVSTHFGYDESDSGEEPMDADGVYGGSAGSGSARTGADSPDRRVALGGTSKELLHLGMSNEDARSGLAGGTSGGSGSGSGSGGIGGGLPATRFNSSNIADIVGSMKSFIDATLSENKIATPAAAVSASASASSSNAGITAANTLFNAATAATSVTTGSAFVHEGDSGDSDADEDEDEEGENSEFLAQLKEYANMDVETLRAIIAAEEAAEALANEENGAEDSRDSSTMLGEPEDGEVVEMTED